MCQHLGVTRPTDPEASVIIPVSEPHYSLLTGQLGRLADQTGSPDFEVLIADNDGRLPRAGFRDEARVRVVDASDVPGPAAARNVGVRAARGKFLLFCDADDLVSLNWVGEHCRALRSLPFTCGALWQVDAHHLQRLATEEMWPADSFSTDCWHHEGLSFAVTANCGVRRHDFDRVGRFPENYRFSEDVAFSFALRQAGITPTFVPAAAVVKLRPVLTARQVHSQQVGLGVAQVALRRDFGFGSSVWVLCAREAGRAVVRSLQHLAARGEVTREAAAANRWRARGTITQALRRRR